MKICDVVLNSIWYDPRVRKQLVSYMADGNETVCVGYKCDRFDADKVAALPCPATIVEMPRQYTGHLRSPLKKLYRLKLKNKLLADAIIEQAPDLIHANDLSVLISSYRASRKLKCVLVYDAHEINTENFRSGKMSGLVKRMMERIERYIMKRSDINLCTNHAASEYFANRYHITAPLVVTNCALQSETVFDVSKRAGFEVLNHGKFYAGRGYDIMVEAAPLLSDLADVSFALRGFGAMEEELKERCKKLDARNVRFYPPVRVEELIREAAASHVGLAITEPICLNFKLSISNKLFEYASAGLPVIMSDIPEHRYLNNKYSFGLILENNTPQKLAEAVRHLYSDKDFYSACAANAKKLALEVNWENEFGQLIANEKAVLNGRR